MLLAAALVLGSCAGRISGRLDAGGAGDFFVSASLEPRISALIRSLAALGGGGQPDDPLINGAAISASMAAAPGIASVSFRNTAAAALEGPVTIANIGDFLASGSGGFIRFEQSGAGGRCTVTISLEYGPSMLSLISPDVSDSLSILMAPLATGEVLGKSEYLDLVSAVYGKALAAEIAESVIRASIDFPGQVRSVKGGSSSGRRAEFVIPLLDLLVLETPLVYEVQWR